MNQATVKFIGGSDGVLSTLEVSAPRHVSLLPALAERLLELGVQVVRAEAWVSGVTVFERLSVVELDGAPIAEPRRLQIQTDVMSVVERAIPSTRPSRPPVGREARHLPLRHRSRAG